MACGFDSDRFVRLTLDYRCTALPEDLDGSTAEHRSQEYNDVLVKTFNSDVLWDQYGIDDDIVVSLVEL